MKKIPFYEIDVTEGFWHKKQELIRKTTINAIYERFSETGRIATMSCKDVGIQPHIFWGSDVFKWIESVAILLEKEDMPELRQKAEAIFDAMEEGVSEDGYYNSYFNLTKEPRFSDRDRHELYSLGHMIEAAIAWDHATGDDRFLKFAMRNTDLVDRIFRVEHSAAFDTPGHEEIELALIKLYRYTSEPRYLELAKYFILTRGNSEKDRQEFGRYLSSWDYGYGQSHKPVKEQREAIGHAVRCLYLFCGVADLYEETGDRELLTAAEAIFDNIVSKKMYITGSMGVSNNKESPSEDYDLPNYQAYTETCAAFAFAIFCARMSNLTAEGKYGNAAERALYNGMLSGLSLDGEAFFYVNPLEIDRSKRNALRLYLPKYERQRVFRCSCCPPNLSRMIPSIADLIYGVSEDRLFIHQYIGNKTTLDNEAVEIETDYPASGKVTVKAGKRKLALRKPDWCKKFTASLPYREEKGYLFFESGDVTVGFEMEPRFMKANAGVRENLGKAALLRGPIVYCLEEQDQLPGTSVFSCRVDPKAPVIVEKESFGDFPRLTAAGVLEKSCDSLYADYSEETTPCALRYIPYYTFANRGEDDMTVWVRTV